MPLGRVYGTHMLWLIPGNGALPKAEPDDPEPDLPYASTQCEAISYPDGYPSEGELQLKGAPGEDEEKLRRFIVLGWVVQGDEKRCKKTGHALVVDLEPGRDRNPWIVLAYHWPNDGEPSWTGECENYASETVERNSSYAEGVLPGDRNRTPVGKIKSLDNSIKRSVLRHFGQDFQFTIVRRGSARGYIRLPRGPGLAHVMSWYLDSKTKEEVCFTKESREYVRFNLETLKIPYCKRATESFTGEDGLHGTICDGGYITLQQCQLLAQQAAQEAGMGASSQQPYPKPDVRSWELSNTSGF